MMQDSSSNVILSLSNLTKSYGDLVAVKDLSLNIFRGEIFGFLGPNGAGKTTTINMICGLLKSDSGEVKVNGRSMENNYRECRKLMGLCPQDLVIWESLTCLEQLEFVGRLYDLRRDNGTGATGNNGPYRQAEEVGQNALRWDETPTEYCPGTGS